MSAYLQEVPNTPVSINHSLLHITLTLNLIWWAIFLTISKSLGDLATAQYRVPAYFPSHSDCQVFAMIAWLSITDNLIIMFWYFFLGKTVLLCSKLNWCVLWFHKETNKHVAIFLRRGCTRAQPTLQLRWFWALEKFISLLAIFCENQLCTFMILANTIDTSCNCMLFRHNILSPGMCSEAWWPLRSWSTSPVGLSGPAWSLLGGRRRWVSTPSNTFKLKNLYIRKRGYSVSQTNEFSL